MRKTLSRITSMFLAVVLMLSLLPMSVFADELTDSQAGKHNGEGDKDLANANMISEQYYGMRFSLYFAEGDWKDLAEAEAATETVLENT